MRLVLNFFFAGKAECLGTTTPRWGREKLRILLFARRPRRVGDKTARVLADLVAGHLDGTWERRLRRYLAPDLLICDDFGLRAFSERQGEDLYELIVTLQGKSYRPQRRPDRTEEVTLKTDRADPTSAAAGSIR